MQGLEEQLFALARSRGMFAKQMCMRCMLMVDEATSIGNDTQCSWCDLAEEEDEWMGLLERARASVKWDEWFASLTTDQQPAYSAMSAQETMIMLGGIMTRDVQ